MIADFLARAEVLRMKMQFDEEVLTARMRDSLMADYSDRAR